MKLNYETTRKDYDDLCRYTRRRINHLIPGRIWWRIAKIAGYVSLGLVAAFEFKVIEFGGPGTDIDVYANGLLALGLVLLIGSVLGRIISMQKSLKEMGLILGSRSVSLEPDGIATTTEFSQCKFAWEMVQAVEEDKEQFYFIVDNAMDILVPKRAFSSENETRAFMEKAREYMERH
ncbi:MAG: YcxB family protein [Alphaproteobacteria bacterium]